MPPGRRHTGRYSHSHGGILPRARVGSEAVMATDQSGLIDILLVEDERADVMLTVQTLREAKLANRLHHAGDAIEALAYLRREDTRPPDLVLLDLGLPGMSGHDLLQQIRTDPFLADLHVVVLSGDDRAETILD